MTDGVHTKKLINFGNQIIDNDLIRFLEND